MAFVASVVALRFRRPYQFVGFVDVDRWHIEGWNMDGYTVLLDGVDISDGGVWFNDITGEAYCLKRNSRGNFYVKLGSDGRELAGHLLRGTVRMVKL